ncbi:Uncharacterised protein [Mycobacterium tuberculosis]|nr:Uncharacterised protein [Mycobacterium tuberculosis]CNX43730.1 Uncharacterised protein [Mycobacterium tuberculosis]
MIEPEKAVESGGILLVALQLVDDRQLLVDQGTATPRHGLKHLVDQQSQPRFLAGQQQGPGVQLVDRMRDLTDFLGGVHRQWLGDRLVAGADRRDLAVEIGMSNLERPITQYPHRPDQRARHHQHDDDRGRDGGQHQHGVANRGIPPVGGLALHRLRHRLGGVGDHLLGNVAGDLYRVQQLWVVDQCNGRIGHDRHPGHHLLLQVLGVRRACTERRAHPEQRRGFGAGQGNHRAAQLRLGKVGAASHQDLLHRHLPAGANGSAQTLHLGSDLLAVNPHRRVNHVLGRQQQRRVGGDPIPQADAVGQHLIQQRLTAVEQRVHSRPHVCDDVGVGQSRLQLVLAGGEVFLRPLHIVSGRAGQHGDVQRRHVFRDRGYHFGARGDQPQAAGAGHRSLDPQSC